MGTKMKFHLFSRDSALFNAIPFSIMQKCAVFVEDVAVVDRHN